ncbi:MAG: hypothetical protein AAGD33_24280 [Actinomycetota bacterium]
MSVAGVDRSVLDERAVAEIVAMTDPAQRNLWITQTYAELAERLREWMGADQTWCSFAIWASNTAGVSIRGEELPHVVTEVLDEVGHHVDAIVERGGDHHLLIGWLAAPLRHSHVIAAVRRALADVSERIAHGNVLVYAELAPLFVRLIDHLDAVGSPAAGDIDALLADIGMPARADEPMLDTAFRSYAAAAGESDPSLRAQLVLTANIAAVLHEQRCLHDDIVASLDAGLFDVAGEVGRLFHRLLPRSVRRVFACRAVERIEFHVEALWEHVVTRRLMTMQTPIETLHLGVDVPAPPGAPLFPHALRRLDHPPLVDLMARWDPTGGTGRGSGARDWARLRDRMGYIVNLFRSRQQVMALTARPFDAEQLAVMDAGRGRPDGRA